VSITTDLDTTTTRLALRHLCANNATAVHPRPNGTAPTKSQIVMILRMIDVGGDRVNTIALTIVVFTTAAPRGRGRPLDVTLGDILSFLQADLEKIGRGGTTMQPVTRLLEVGWGDANKQVIDLKVRLLLIRCLYVGFPPARAFFIPAHVKRVGMTIL
jgi:hypothetical protein